MELPGSYFAKVTIQNKKELAYFCKVSLNDSL